MFYFLGGFVVGVIIALVIIRLRTSTAIFRIDSSNPEHPICRLDLNNINLAHKSKLLLKIDHNARLTQE